jgi:single-strand DNA-binding protein
MLYLNRVDIIGNLTRDPEVRFTTGNQPIASFAVATNRRYRDASGNMVDAPAEYHEVVVWGQLGERCGNLLHKGDRIFASGRLQTRSWEAQDGAKKYRTELVADTIIGPDQVNRAGGVDGMSTNAPAARPMASHSAAPIAATPMPTDEINIDDIPF